MENDTSKNDQSILDELTFTLKELNKAMGNVQYMAATIKDLDLAGLLTGESKSNLLKLLKNIDLEQVLSVIQSPLVQQILKDPEFLALFLPDTNQTASNQSHQPYLGSPDGPNPRQFYQQRQASPFGFFPQQQQQTNQQPFYQNGNQSPSTQEESTD